MRKATLFITSLLLVVPAVAEAKGGVEFDTYPDEAKVGQQINFTVLAISEPRGPNGGEPRPIVGAHPLVTFRSESGRVVRVRARRTNLNGMGYGSVAFPDQGPWTTEIRAASLHIPAENSEPIHVGIGLTQTTPPAKAADPIRAADTKSFPWAWVLSLASIGSALLVLTMRRRGHWGAA